MSSPPRFPLNFDAELCNFQRDVDCTISSMLKLDAYLLSQIMHIIVRFAEIKVRCINLIYDIGYSTHTHTQTDWHYSENARVCAKWQWNARDCATGLHDRRSRECNPVTPVECVSLSFRTHPCVLVFSHTYSVQTELWWLLANAFNTIKLLVVTYFSNSQFVLLRCWVLVKHAV